MQIIIAARVDVEWLCKQLNIDTDLVMIELYFTKPFFTELNFFKLQIMVAIIAI